MATKKRDELQTPPGKKGVVPAGGKAGRTPGLGTRNNAGTKPGQGVDGRPQPGYGLSASRRKPPPEERPQPQTKPKDES